jgi:competence protein ComFC
MNLKNFIKDILFPKECLCCKKEGDWLCPECFKKLEFNKKKYRLDNLDKLLVAGDYENEILAKIIKLFKYQFVKDIHKILAEFIFLFLSDKKIDLSESLIIPVPLSKKRLKWRGFNQAEILAKKISNKFNLDFSNDLKRIKYQKPQASLSEKERKINLINSFSWQGKNLKNKKIILVDDVVTTGSTLNECAKTLKNAGARKIWGLVIAKG